MKRNKLIGSNLNLRKLQPIYNSVRSLNFKIMDMRVKFFLGCLLLAIGLQAQDLKRQIVVPLSSPGERGSLIVGQVNGSITVTAYEGEEVIIDATYRENSKNKDKDKGRGNPPPGMKRIESTPAQIRAREDDNEVEVETESWKRKMDLAIKLPANFDLNLHTVHGDIEVRDIDGEMEISGVNGGIKLDEISGSAVCSTVNGDVVVRLNSIENDVPMSFVTLNGNVDVTIPGDAKVLAKMKSDRGEIFSDFDMSMIAKEPEVRRGSDCDCEYEVSLNAWTFGEINGGGAEFTFKNMNGDILIRKGR